MNVLVVYAHHEPRSFTAALKNVTMTQLEAAGHTVTLSDLYGQGFQSIAEKYDFVTSSGQAFNYMHEQKHAALHDMAFSPDILGEIHKLQAADLVIFHFPLWWSSVPAILKGWFDRVLAMGFAWDGHDQIFESGLLRGKKALVAVTAARPAEYYTPEGPAKASIEQILHPVLHGTLWYCGIDVQEPYLVFDILNKTDEQRAQLLELYTTHLSRAIGQPLGPQNPEGA